MSGGGGGRLKYRVAESKRRWRAFKEKVGTFQARWQAGRKETCEKNLQWHSSSKEGGCPGSWEFRSKLPSGGAPCLAGVASCDLHALVPGCSSSRKRDLGGDLVDGVPDAPCGQRVEPHVAVAPSALTDECGVGRVVERDAGPRSRRCWRPVTGFWIQCLLLTLPYPTVWFAL